MNFRKYLFIMRKAKLKGFTLLEMLIVMVIIWILAIVLCESYITISKIALKVEQEKDLSEESLLLTQVFQAISDEATIDYEKYNWELVETEWFTKTLYLTWWQRSWTSIYTTWTCIDLDWNFLPESDGSYRDYSQDVKDALSCMLVMKRDWDNSETILTSQWKVITSQVLFKIIPYDSEDNYFSEQYTNDILINNLHQPAFWVFTHLYARLYQPVWTNKIDQPLQLFFNLNI